jgi:hypothetical protein
MDGAPVLDPRLPLLRMAEMLVDMRRAGFGVSRRGFYWGSGAQPSPSCYSSQATSSDVSSGSSQATARPWNEWLSA